MARQYAKLSVSDYKFYNENDEVIAEVDYLKSESIQYNADGSIVLYLTNAIIDLDLKEKFKDAVKLDMSYLLRDITNGEDIEVTNTYYHIKIVYVTMKAENADVAIMDMKIVGLDHIIIAIPEDEDREGEPEPCTCETNECGENCCGNCTIKGETSDDE